MKIPMNKQKNKRLLTMACAFACLISKAALAAPCLPTEALIAGDAKYEEAMRVGDVAYLQSWLADDYVWVHTLASAIESKAVILARAQSLSQSQGKAAMPKARTTSEVHAHALGDSVVLRGLSTVDQWNADGKTWRSNRYQFMRTYVTVDGKCKLLAVQTMKVWSSETKKAAE